MENHILIIDELKLMLKQYIRKDEFWNENRTNNVVQSMMQQIGSTDYELRDKLIYQAFCKLILNNQLEEELLIELAETCLSDYFLFKGIGENGTDTVFTRSFTTLLLAVIIYKDNETDFLTTQLVNEIKEKLLLYIESEQDVRGYVPQKGWAHSIAHVSDTIDELVKNKKIDKKDYIIILHVLWSKILFHSTVYMHDEDERILVPIISMLNNNLKLDELENLIKSLPYVLQSRKEKINEENYWFLVANCKSFLKTFYIKIDDDERFLPLQKTILECLSNI